jgi:hypothetical protein
MPKSTPAADEFSAIHADMFAATRAPKAAPAPDHAHATELELHADNSQHLYNMRNAIHSNMMKKHAAGKYDHALAAKGYMHLADAADKDYAKTYGANRASVATRAHVAKRFADAHHPEKTHKNDDPRNFAAQPASGGAQKARVLGMGMDKNGNHVVKVGHKGGAFTIQTNGNIPSAHKHSGKAKDLSPEAHDKIMKEAHAHVSAYGTPRAKKIFGIVGKGGGEFAAQPGTFAAGRLPKDHTHAVLLRGEGIGGGRILKSFKTEQEAQTHANEAQYKEDKKPVSKTHMYKVVPLDDAKATPQGRSHREIHMLKATNPHFGGGNFAAQPTANYDMKEMAVLDAKNRPGPRHPKHSEYMKEYNRAKSLASKK